MKGIFVTVEGPDGAGKTTLIKALIPKLQECIHTSILSTREPGGNVIAERIREVILDPTATQMDARTEALLYAAARRQHLVDNIVPAIEKGNIVVCDRFVDSSIAYQGYARGIGRQGIEDINMFATGGMQPDLTFYVDVPSEEGLRRIQQNRTDEVNRLDLEGLAFHETVRQGYLILANEQTERIVCLKGLQSTEQLVEQCLAVLKERFAYLFK